MIMRNKFLALCLGIIGLVAIGCHAAELPPTPAPASAAAAAASVTPTDQLTAIEGYEGGDDEDEEMWIMGDAEELEDSEDYLEEFISPEEELAELSEEQSEIKQDCAELANMIQEAKNNGTAVDPDLQEEYDICQQDLKDIETDMQTLSDELTDNE